MKKLFYYLKEELKNNLKVLNNNLKLKILEFGFCRFYITIITKDGEIKRFIVSSNIKEIANLMTAMEITENEIKEYLSFTGKGYESQIKSYSKLTAELKKTIKEIIDYQKDGDCSFVVQGNISKLF